MWRFPSLSLPLGLLNECFFDPSAALFFTTVTFLAADVFQDLCKLEEEELEDLVEETQIGEDEVMRMLHFLERIKNQRKPNQGKDQTRTQDNTRCDQIQRRL